MEGQEQTGTAGLAAQDGAGVVATTSTVVTGTAPEGNPNITDNGSSAAPEGAAAQDGAGQEGNEFYGAPENYDYKDLQLPEGFQIDAALAEKFAPLGKELNLSQQGVNKLANFLVEIQQSQLADADGKLAEYKKQELEATKLGYEKLLNSDKEIGGGDKAKMDAYLDVADVGYNSFASDELKNVLAGLHLDYHPAVVKHFYRLGKLCGNDNISKPKAPVGSQQSVAQILFGDNGADAE